MVFNKLQVLFKKRHKKRAENLISAPHHILHTGREFAPTNNKKYSILEDVSASS